MSANRFLKDELHTCHFVISLAKAHEAFKDSVDAVLRFSLFIDLLTALREMLQDRGFYSFKICTIVFNNNIRFIYSREVCHKLKLRFYSQIVIGILNFKKLSLSPHSHEDYA